MRCMGLLIALLCIPSVLPSCTQKSEAPQRGNAMLNTKTNNYRDIRTSAATARAAYTVIFKFDGKEYRAQTSHRFCRR